MNVTECKVQLYLPRVLFRQLKSAAGRTGTSLSAYLRALLTSHVSAGSKDFEDPLLKLLANRKPYGPRDGSRNVDRHLYRRR